MLLLLAKNAKTLAKDPELIFENHLAVFDLAVREQRNLPGIVLFVHPKDR
jgi:hypothetical protein